MPDALAKRALAALLAQEKYLDEYVKPMGTFVVRFSGKPLAHVGKATLAAIERLLEGRAGISYRGYLTTAGKAKRYERPKATVGAGRTTLTKALSGLEAMPEAGTKLYFQDAGSQGLVPGDHAFFLSLDADLPLPGRGFLSCAFPLGSLEDPRWLALVDELVVLLAADAAWLGPGVWLAPFCLFNGSLNQIRSEQGLIDLLATDPQVDQPNLEANAWPYGSSPGLPAPAWRMWLGARLAKQVAKYGGTTAKLPGGAMRYHVDESPFAMTARAYQTWLTRWAELAPAQVTYEDARDRASHAATRFAAPSLAALGEAWRRTRADKVARETREREITRGLAERRNDPSLLGYAESVAKEMTSSHAWYFLPGLQTLVEQGAASPAEALVWLDILEPLGNTLLPKLAAVATAAGDHDRAIDLLRRARETHQIASLPELRRDPDFKALRRHPLWKKLVA